LSGANRRYIEEHIPHISRLMVGSLDEVLDHAEVILIGNQCEEFTAALPRMHAGQTVIDLTPAGPRPQSSALYERISS
jgi:GDP-mannose 6-dehydrogenase